MPFMRRRAMISVLGFSMLIFGMAVILSWGQELNRTSLRRIALAAAATIQSPVLTHGGLVGAVTDTTAAVWARANRAAKLKIQYRPRSSVGEWLTSEGTSLAEPQDFTGTVRLGRLEPDTTYDYRILLDDMVQIRKRSLTGFATLPPVGTAGTLNFAIGADLRYDRRPFPIFSEIRKREPDFMIFMGDQIYADFPARGAANTKAEYEAKYKENWAEPYLSDFMANIPTFMIWDDHEIKDNYWRVKLYGGGLDRYGNARSAYDEYQGSHNPSPRVVDQIYYSFRAGQVDFYLLDTRSFRSPNGTPDTSRKTILGETQKEDLKAWLATSKAKFKFIVSSVLWNATYGESTSDFWTAFRTERSEIFNFIRNNRIRGVILLSGDAHYAGVFRYTQVAPYFLYEFSPTPLGTDLGVRCSRRASPCDRRQVLFDYDKSRVYGFFEIDTRTNPARLKFTLFTQLTAIYSLSITENDISPAGGR